LAEASLCGFEGTFFDELEASASSSATIWLAASSVFLLSSAVLNEQLKLLFDCS